ncbi:MAG: universal stress protein [Pseudomonadota bacterium]
MTRSFAKPKKILAVADTSDAQIALTSALALAETHGASVEVIACVEPPPELSILSRFSGENPQQLIDDAVRQTREVVEARLAQIAPASAQSLTVAVGKAYLEIIRHAARSKCDFVVKKAEPLSGMERFLFASNDQHLLRKCPCPVWLTTGTAPASPRRILATVDLDIADADESGTLAALNRRVVAAACAMAVRPDTEVTVLHAWEAIGEGMVWTFAGGNDARLSVDRYVNEVLAARHKEMDTLLAQLRNDIGARPRLVPLLVRGSPETVIHQQSRDLSADVVVMGTVARTGLSGVFIGNTAENIINRLECPVLAVKPEGFVSPLLHD